MRVLHIVEQDRIDAGAVSGVHAHLYSKASMSLWYVLLAASRLIIDAEAGRNEPATVLLVNGPLVTAFAMFINTREETCATSWQASNPYRGQCSEGLRSVEDGEGGKDFNPER